LLIEMRKATNSDLEKIYEIELECFAEDAFSKTLLRYIINSKNFLTIVAVADGEPVGFISGYINHEGSKKVGHVYTLDVKGGFRRRGIGSSLLTALENAFVEMGVVSCYLEVRAENIGALRLYNKHGYEKLSVMKHYYGFGVDGIRLKKNLNRKVPT